MRRRRLAGLIIGSVLLCGFSFAHAQDGLLRSTSFRALIAQNKVDCGCTPKVEQKFGCAPRVKWDFGCGAARKLDCGCAARGKLDCGCDPKVSGGDCGKCRPSLKSMLGDKLGRALRRIDCTLQNIFPCHQIGVCPSSCGKSACQPKVGSKSKCGCGMSGKKVLPMVGEDIPLEPQPERNVELQPEAEGESEAAPLLNSDPPIDDDEQMTLVPSIPSAFQRPAKPTRVKQPEQVAEGLRLPLTLRPVNASPLNRLR